ncbi:MAG TPA: universal stress protein [Bacteroidia bacterium]|nr:universal stress protein [Bacteroidia bacterium]
MIKFNPRRILMPYDFSKNADKALSHAAFMCALLKCDLYLLHVISKSEIIDILLPVFKMKNNQVLVNLVNEKLDMVSDRIRKQYGIKVKTLVSTGNITSEIVDISKENKVDLIIMGTQGSGSKSDLFLGSTAYRLITKSHIPVMTVKEPGSKKGYENICIPIDFSDNTRQKVDYALSMARAFMAKITILGLYDEDEKEQRFKLETIAEQVAILARKHNIKAETFVDKTRHRVNKTNSFAKKHKVDLIITMTDQKKDQKFTVLNSYDHELVHTSKVPVISIHPEHLGVNAHSPNGLPY